MTHPIPRSPEQESYETRHREQLEKGLTVPVAVSSPPTQSTPSKEAFFTEQIASMIVFWSLLPSATKSGYLSVSQFSMKVEPT